MSNMVRSIENSKKKKAAKDKLKKELKQRNFMMAPMPRGEAYQVLQKVSTDFNTMHEQMRKSQRRMAHAELLVAGVQRALKKLGVVSPEELMDAIKIESDKAIANNTIQAFKEKYTYDKYKVHFELCRKHEIDFSITPLLTKLAQDKEIKIELREKLVTEFDLPKELSKPYDDKKLTKKETGESRDAKMQGMEKTEGEGETTEGKGDPDQKDNLDGENKDNLKETV